MNIKVSIFVSILALSAGLHVDAQTGEKTLTADKTISYSAQAQTTDASRKRREQAYVKLLEGQRYIWQLSRTRSAAGVVSYTKSAKQAFQKAVELDPTLAEGYTALANLAKNTPPYDIDESMLFAGIAAKIDPNNFGAHLVLAQLYTYKSRLNRSALDPAYAQKAIAEWKEIARLDPRNAEAFAFLSEFYGSLKQKTERIAALRSWLSAATPISDGFYGRVFQTDGNDPQTASLAPQAATVKLGKALLEDKQIHEAVEVLSRAVSEEPENAEAIQLLSLAVQSADNNSVETAVQSLQQAVFANPDNPAISLLLAQVQSRTGKVDDAVKILRDASVKFADKDKVASADLQVALADIYGESNRVDEAAAVYQDALTTRGIVVKNNVLPDADRSFAAQVFEKLVNLYKKANRPGDAKAATERAKLILGN